MRPLNSYILIKKVEESEKTNGGLFIPNTIDRGVKVTRGEVLAVNKDCVDLSVGDLVIYNKYAEHLTDKDTPDVVLVRIEDIEAIYG